MYIYIYIAHRILSSNPARSEQSSSRCASASSRQEASFDSSAVERSVASCNHLRFRI